MARWAGGCVVDEQANVQVVEGMFSALARGDIAGVLDRLSDDIEWRIARPSELPYAGIHRGRDEVARFFQTFGREAEFEIFEPWEYIAKRNKVVVLGHERQRIKATGRVVETDWAMVFALRDGRITRFRNFVDSRDAVETGGAS
jgi:ketosteroid isomerase-like protein